MDQLEFKQQRISELINLLRGGHSDKEEDAFDNLSMYVLDEDLDFIFDKIMSYKIPQIILWLIRYLTHVSSNRALEQLISLAKSDDYIIRAEVMSSIRALADGDRIKCYIKILDFEDELTKSLAIRELSNLGSSAAVHPLMNCYQDTQAIKIKTSILRCLGRIRDRRSITFLEKIAIEQVEELQSAALEALSWYAETVHTRFIRQCLQSDNVRTRKIAHLHILKQPVGHFEQFTILGLNIDEEEEIKIEIISSLRTINSKKLFRKIIMLSSEDPSESVRMVASTIFRKIRSKKILKWILSDIAHQRSGYHEELLRALSSYSKENKVFGVFKKYALQEENKQLKLIAIENLGYCKNIKALEFLRNLIISDETFSYVAGISLTHLLNHRHWDIVEDLLDLDQAKHSSIIQLVLQFIHRIHHEYKIPISIRSKLKELTESHSLNIRYLAIRAFSNCVQTQESHVLIGFLAKNSNPMIREGCIRSIKEMVLSNKDAFEILIRSSLSRRSTIVYLIRLVDSMEWDEFNYTILMKSVVEQIYDYDRRGDEYQKKQIPRLMSLLRKVCKLRMALFYRQMLDREWRDDEYRIMMMIINRTNLHSMGGLNAEPLSDLFFRSNRATKAELLHFFKKLRRPEEKIKSLIFSSISEVQEKNLGVPINAVVREWVNNG